MVVPTRQCLGRLSAVAVITCALIAPPCAAQFESSLRGISWTGDTAWSATLDRGVATKGARLATVCFGEQERPAFTPGAFVPGRSVLYWALPGSHASKLFVSDLDSNTTDGPNLIAGSVAWIFAVGNGAVAVDNEGTILRLNRTIASVIARVNATKPVASYDPGSNMLYLYSGSSSTMHQVWLAVNPPAVHSFEFSCPGALAMFVNDATTALFVRRTSWLGNREMVTAASAKLVSGASCSDIISTSQNSFLVADFNGRESISILASDAMYVVNIEMPDVEHLPVEFPSNFSLLKYH